jgi:hypothetical protein
MKLFKGKGKKEKEGEKTKEIDLAKIIQASEAKKDLSESLLKQGKARRLSED